MTLDDIEATLDAGNSPERASEILADLARHCAASIRGGDDAAIARIADLTLRAIGAREPLQDVRTFLGFQVVFSLAIDVASGRRSIADAVASLDDPDVAPLMTVDVAHAIDSMHTSGPDELSTIRTPHLELAGAIARKSGDASLFAFVATHLGTWIGVSDSDAAIRWYREALAMEGRIDPPLLHAMLFNNFNYLLLLRGELEEAIAVGERTLRAIGHDPARLIVFQALCRTYAEAGETKKRQAAATVLASTEPRDEESRGYAIHGLRELASIHRARGQYRSWNRALNRALFIAVEGDDFPEMEAIARRVRSIGASPGIRRLSRDLANAGGGVPDFAEAWLVEARRDATATVLGFDETAVPGIDPAVAPSAVDTLLARGARAVGDGLPFEAVVFARTAAAWAGAESQRKVLATALEAEAWFDIGDIRRAGYLFSRANALWHETVSKDAAGDGVIDMDHPFVATMIRLTFNTGICSAVLGDSAGRAMAGLSSILPYTERREQHDLALDVYLALGDLGLIHEYPRTALTNYGRAFELAVAHGTDAQRAASAFWLATALQRTGSDEEAAARFADAAEHAEKNGDGDLARDARAQRFLALHAAAGPYLVRLDGERAEALLRQALDEVAWAPYHPGKNIAAVVRSQLGAALLAQRREAEGRELLHQSFEELKAAGQIDAALAAYANLLQYERHTGNKEIAEQLRQTALALAIEHGRAEWGGRLRQMAPPPPQPPASDAAADPLDGLVAMIQQTESDAEAAEIVRREAQTLDDQIVDRLWRRVAEFQQPASRVFRAFADACPPGLRGADIARALLYAARIEQAFQRYDVARSLYERMLDALPPVPEEEREPLASEAFGGLGSVHGLRGEHRPAIEYFERAVVLRRKLGLQERLAAALGNLAAQFLDSGDPARAIAPYEEALTLRLELGNHSGAVTAACSLARIDQRLGNAAHALERLETAWNYTTGDVEDQLHVLEVKAEVLQNTGDLDAARTTLVESERLASKPENPEVLLKTYLNRARLERTAGRLDDAIAAAERAQEIARRFNATQKSIDVTRLIADIESKRGRHDAAVAFLDEAVAAARAAESSDSLRRVAWSRWNVARLDDAIDLTLEAHQLAVEHNDEPAAAEALTQAGMISWYRGDLLRARDYQMAALALEERALGRRQPDTLDALAITLRDLGDHSNALQVLMESASARPEPNVETLTYYAMQLRELDNPELALAYVDEAIGQAMLRGDRSRLAFAYAMTASILGTLGIYNIAAARAEQACEIFFDELQDEVHGLQALLPLADAQHALGKPDEAEAAYRRAIDIAGRYSLRHLGASVANNLAVLHRESGRVDEALEQFEAVAQVCGDIGFKGLQGHALGNAAELLYSRGDFEGARERLLRSLELEEELRRVLDPMHHFAVRRGLGNRALLAAFVSASMGRNGDAWNYAERARARLLSEQLRGHVATFEEIRASLAATGEPVAIVEYLFHAGKLLITLVDAAHDVPVVRLVAAEKLEDVVSAAVERVRQGERLDSIEELRTLEQMLVQPIAAEIGACRVLAISPYRQLWSVPFPVIPAGSARLGQRFRLTFLPSASILVPEPPTFGEKTSAAVVGDPNGDLPFARKEARRVAELLGADPVIGPEATRARVAEMLGRVSVLHFGGHGFYADGESQRAGIRVADGVLLAEELAAGTRGVPLVVLSGCGTGRVAEMGGGEIGGLPGALLGAGSRSVVSSQWMISDSAAYEVMARLYASMRRGESVVDALAAAMGDPASYAAAPFIVVGDWRTRLTALH